MAKSKALKKWSLRITVTGLFLFALLLGIALNPVLLYANSSAEGNYTVYHQQKLPPDFVNRLNAASKLLQHSAIYDPALKLSVCLYDGSYYPALMRRIMGNAFGYGFANNVVLMGHMNAAENYIEINNYRWNLTELITHEAMHCFEFHHYGLLHSNPLARIPEWKWEGYPEYIARKNKADLARNITHLLETEKQDNNGWINFGDSTGTVIPYYKAWLLVQYCIDVEKLSIDQLLRNTTSEKTTTLEMMNWYLHNQ